MQSRIIHQYRLKKWPNILEAVNNFKYHDSWMESMRKYIEVRKALTWSSFQKLRKIRNSTLSRQIKRDCSFLPMELCGYASVKHGHIKSPWEENWTYIPQECPYLLKYRECLNVTWEQEMKNKELFEELPPVTDNNRKICVISWSFYSAPWDYSISTRTQGII